MEQYLPEFHTALIAISGALIAAASIVTALLGTREAKGPLSQPFIVATLPLLIFSIVLGILAMWYAFDWFLNPNVTMSFRAVYFLLGQAALIIITLGVYTGTLLFRSKTGGIIVNTRDMEKFKEQLIAFRDVLGEVKLAPASPVWAGFASFMLLKESQRLRLLTMGLFALTIILALLTGWDIWLRLTR